MSRRFIFNSMDDCEPRAIGRCSFSLDMGSFAHQSTMPPIQVVGCEPPLCRSCGPACGPARASIHAKSCFQPSPPCGGSRERSMSWGAGVPPQPQTRRAGGCAGMLYHAPPCHSPLGVRRARGKVCGPQSDPALCPNENVAHLTLPTMCAQVRHFSPLGLRCGPRRTVRMSLSPLLSPPSRRRR